MASTEEYDREMALYHDLMAELRAKIPERALRSRVSPDLIRPWLEEYMADDATLRRGRLATDLVRLGDAIWPSLAQLLKGGVDVDTERLTRDARGPYGLHIYVKNLGKTPLGIETHARRVVIKANDIGAPRRWHDRPQVTQLEPGGVLDLSLHYAIVALRRHGWQIYDPALWESSSAVPQRAVLHEVGYSCDALGIDSREVGTRRAKKAS